MNSAARLFFALWPDAPTRAAVHRACRQAVRAAGGRPVPPASYHLTLLFLGSVAGAQLPALLAGARQLAPPVVNLCLDRFGYFPAARVFWLGSQTPVPALAGLAARLHQLALDCGLAPDGRPWQAHLTLCRKVSQAPRVPPPRPVRWRTRSFALVASRTAAAGARYEVLETFTAGSCPEP